MIYDLLKAYKEWLGEGFRPSTTKTYYEKLCTLFEGQSLKDTANRLDIAMILDKLGGIKHKKPFSQSKNAFLQFCEFQSIRLPAETLARISDLEEATRKKRRQLKEVDFPQVEKKIKHIRNKRLKLSYQTMIATGLRVSELADIAPNDCTIAEEAITFGFIARGGTNAVATIEKASYPKLYNDIKILVENHSQDKRLFYSADYLQKKAKELGFACHDLRRAFAKLEYKKSRSKAHVMEKMRHKSIKATKGYLRSKVKL